MQNQEYKKTVRTIGDVNPSDKAAVIGRMKDNGQIIIVNAGEEDSLKKLYNTLALAATGGEINKEGGAE